MFRALSLAIGQLGDRAILRVLATSIALTLLLFAALLGAIWALIEGLDPCGWFGWPPCVIGGGMAGLVAIMLGAVSLWFLFPPVAIGIVGLFADQIVDAVEAAHYPTTRASRGVGMVQAAGLALRSAGRLILWNIVAIPGYLLLVVTGIGPFILFLAINALVLGRDLGEMVAVRHLEREERTRWLKATSARYWALGVLVTIAFLMPFANLVAPVIGAAMATHLFHASRSRG